MVKATRIDCGRWSGRVQAARRQIATFAALIVLGCSTSSTPPDTAHTGTNRSEPSAGSAVQPPNKTAVSQTAPANVDRSPVQAPTDSKREIVDPSPTLDGRVAVRTDAHGRKWLGDVPYDVFFDD